MNFEQYLFDLAVINLVDKSQNQIYAHDKDLTDFDNDFIDFCNRCHKELGIDRIHINRDDTTQLSKLVKIYCDAFKKSTIKNLRLENIILKQDMDMVCDNYIHVCYTSKDEIDFYNVTARDITLEDVICKDTIKLENSEPNANIKLYTLKAKTLDLTNFKNLKSLKIYDGQLENVILNENILSCSEFKCEINKIPYTLSEFYLKYSTNKDYEGISDMHDSGLFSFKIK